MAHVVTDAIVLHSFDYLESSRILRLVTREAGRALGAGARRASIASAASVARWISTRRERRSCRSKTGRELDTLSGVRRRRVRARSWARSSRASPARARSPS